MRVVPRGLEPGAVSRGGMGPLRRRLPTAVVAFLMFDALMASNAPSPLYVVYQRQFHFSALVVTAVFATYAVAVLVTLIVVGRVSDTVGRRPVLAAGLALMVASAVIFIVASDVTYLFVARAVQGVGTGALTGAATAALVEVDPGRDRRRASLVNTVAFISGAGVGPLLFGAVADNVGRPTVTPFVVEVCLFAAAGVGLLALPETVAGATSRVRLTVARPSVPRAARKVFALASAAVTVSWSVGALYGALSPAIDRRLLHLGSHTAAGFVLFAFNMLGGAAQLALRRWSPRASMTGGVACLGLGMALVESSLFAGSVPLFAVGTVFTGVGGGISFMGALAAVNDVAPSRHRAEVVSAFNVVGYLALSAPVLGVGLLSSTVGLLSATAAFTAVLVAAAGAVLVLLRRAEEALFDGAGGLDGQADLEATRAAAGVV